MQMCVSTWLSWLAMGVVASLVVCSSVQFSSQRYAMPTDLVPELQCHTHTQPPCSFLTHSGCKHLAQNGCFGPPHPSARAQWSACCPRGRVQIWEWGIMCVSPRNTQTCNPSRFSGLENGARCRKVLAGRISKRRKTVVKRAKAAAERNPLIVLMITPT